MTKSEYGLSFPGGVSMLDEVKKLEIHNLVDNDESIESLLSKEHIFESRGVIKEAFDYAVANDKIEYVNDNLVLSALKHRANVPSLLNFFAEQNENLTGKSKKACKEAMQKYCASHDNIIWLEQDVNSLTRSEELTPEAKLLLTSEKNKWCLKEYKTFGEGFARLVNEKRDELQEKSFKKATKDGLKGVSKAFSQEESAGVKQQLINYMTKNHPYELNEMLSEEVDSGESFIADNILTYGSPQDISKLSQYSNFDNIFQDRAPYNVPAGEIKELEYYGE